MIEYKALLIRHGVRRYSDLKAPRFKPSSTVQLPYGGVYHFMTDNPDVLGPTLDDPFLRDVNRAIYIQHVLDYAATEGNIRKVATPMIEYTKEYRRRNNSIRPIKTDKALEGVLRDGRSVIIENYSLIDKQYTYYNHRLMNYYRWLNMWVTVLSTITKIAEASPTRQQFIQINAPSALYTRMTYLTASNNGNPGIAVQSIRRFNDPAQLTFLDLFRWLGKDRDASVLAKYITPEVAKTVNLCFVEHGYWTFVNLGTLDTFRDASAIADTAEDQVKLEKDALRGGSKVTPVMMQRSLLDFMLQVSALSKSSVSDLVAAQVLSEQEKADDDGQPGGVPSTERPTAVKEKKEKTDTIAINSSTRPSDVRIDDDDEVIEDEGTGYSPHDADPDDAPDLSEEYIDSIIAAADDAMRDFEEVSEKLGVDGLGESESDADAAEDTETPLPDPIEEAAEPAALEDHILQYADELVRKGAITPQAYKRAQRNAVRYKSIPNPFGEGTLEDLLKETPKEAFKLQEKNRLDTLPEGVDAIPGVTDESLLNSTKDAMDKKFMKDFYRKYIVKNAITPLMKSGAPVVSYTVKTVKSPFGDKEIHTIKTDPVRGAPASVEFTIPVIKEDMSFRTGNNRYRMRSQRTDRPIRKTSSTEVMFSSYYGNRLFLRRSERKAFNYSRWLVEAITAKGLDSEDKSVTELLFNDVFDRDVKGSSVYGFISQTFSGFHVPGFNLTWDYAEHKAQPVVPGQEEIPDSVGNLLYCGADNKGARTLWIDQNNDIFAYEGIAGAAERLGKIEDLCKFEPSAMAKRPIEVLEIQLSGQMIPIGIVLGWKWGLRNLIARAKLNVRIHDRKGPQRYTLGEGEFAVLFEDKMVVGQKGDRLAEFVLGSLLRFKNINRLPMRTFESPRGWVNAMSANGLGDRYVRALNDVYDLFIDPITEDILREMGEPTTMDKLFMRGVEMLLDESYKSATDFYEMRDRGYERIAGFIYTQTTAGARKFRSRSVAASSSLTINPRAVWMDIVRDPACSMVEESNPIHNIKERDIVIYGGIGGRTGRTLQERDRTYNKADLGVRSEGSVENGSIGTVLYVSADPDYGNVFGMRTERPDTTDIPAGKLLSVAALTTPGADRDD